MPRPRRYEGTITTSFYVPLELKELIENLDKLAKAEDTTRNEIILRALMQYVNEKGAQLELPTIERKISLFDKAQVMDLYRKIKESINNIDWISGMTHEEMQFYDHFDEPDRIRRLEELKSELREYLKKVEEVLKKHDDPNLRENYEHALLYAYPEFSKEIEKLRKQMNSGTLNLNQFNEQLKALTKRGQNN
jgi:hypothetical protein